MTFIASSFISLLLLYPMITSANNLDKRQASQFTFFDIPACANSQCSSAFELSGILQCDSTDLKCVCRLLGGAVGLRGLIDSCITSGGCPDEFEDAREENRGACDRVEVGPVVDITSVLPSPSPRRTNAVIDAPIEVDDSRPTITADVASTTSKPITSATDDAKSAEETQTPVEASEGGKKDGDDISVPIIVAIAVGGTGFLVLCVGIYFLIRCLRRRKQNTKDSRKPVTKNLDSGASSPDLTPVGATRGIPLKEKTTWGSDEENAHPPSHNNSTANLFKPVLPQLNTSYSPALPRRAPSEISPVSPVSPLSEYYADRKSRAVSAVSSVKSDDNYMNYYNNITSPPLPIPVSRDGQRPHLGVNTGTMGGYRNNNDHMQEPVSPLSRNPSAKSTKSDVSAIGTETFGLYTSGYPQLIQKYEEHQNQQNSPLPRKPQPPPQIIAPPTQPAPAVFPSRPSIQEFDFGFDHLSVSDPPSRISQASQTDRGHLTVIPPGSATNPRLSVSSSQYSDQSDTLPNPNPRRPSHHHHQHLPANPKPDASRKDSVRWRKDVEAATEQALKRIVDSEQQSGASGIRNGKKEISQQSRDPRRESSGFLGKLRRGSAGSGVGAGTTSTIPLPPRGPGGQVPLGGRPRAGTVSLEGDEGKSGVVII